jgi:hypothetical protein
MSTLWATSFGRTDPRGTSGGSRSNLEPPQRCYRSCIDIISKITPRLSTRIRSQPSLRSCICSSWTILLSPPLPTHALFWKLVKMQSRECGTAMDTCNTTPFMPCQRTWYYPSTIPSASGFSSYPLRSVASAALCRCSDQRSHCSRSGLACSH